MFGYIKPYVPELKVADNELYGAVYCGLCKSMKNVTGRRSRLTLSYDITFLALVLSSLYGEKLEVYTGRCLLNPFKKKPVARENEILRMCSAVSAELTYFAALDKKADERGVKRLAACLTLPTLKRMKKKADSLYNFTNCPAEELLTLLHGLEAEHSFELDRCAALFGDVLAYYFSYCAPEGKKESATLIGRYTGMYIYIADACDDLEKDRKSGSYNPLLYGEGDEAVKLSGARGTMCILADKAAGELALEGSPGREYDICDNILRLGMVDRARKVTDKTDKKRK